MLCQASFDQWRTIIMQHLSHLSKPQATVLAMWSFGMVLARSCALTAVSQLLAAGMPRQEPTGRQQRREWSYDVPRQRGTKRPALCVETCFAPLLGWVVRGWQGLHLALALDAPTLGPRFVVLAVSVVDRGCAIPVAWVILPAGAKHAGRRAWLRLLRRLRPAIPQGWTVLVLAEGSKAPWLILTDLAPAASDAGWYGLRAWIEPGLKITNRAGWPWHRTRMSHPARAARLWLAVAVATLWRLRVGGAADETVPARTLLDVTALCPGRPRMRRATRLRLGSVCRQGWGVLLVALLRQEPVPEGRFVPAPWLTVLPWEEAACKPDMALPEAA